MSTTNDDIRAQLDQLTQQHPDRYMSSAVTSTPELRQAIANALTAVEIVNALIGIANLDADIAAHNTSIDRDIRHRNDLRDRLGALRSVIRDSLE